MARDYKDMKANAERQHILDDWYIGYYSCIVHKHTLHNGLTKYFYVIGKQCSICEAYVPANVWAVALLIEPQTARGPYVAV